MKQLKYFLIILCFLGSGCMTIQGSTVKDKQNYILEMREDVLSELYSLEPGTKQQVEYSGGYAVFSTAGIHLFLVGTGNGFGVVRDQAMKKDIYMKMFKAGGGLGLGVKDFRMVIVFNRQEDVSRFIENGWDFTGEMDFAAKTYEDGIALSTARSADMNITVYQLTRAGISLQAMLYATKFWKLDELNQ